MAMLEECVTKLGRTPRMGRPCVQVRQDLWRVESGKHVVFNRLKGREIFVSRILHQGMLPRPELSYEDEA